MIIEVIKQVICSSVYEFMEDVNEIENENEEANE